MTLMVWPEQAERIALAVTEGQIMLALRNPSDRRSVQTLGIKSDEMMARPLAATPVPSPGRIAERRPAPRVQRTVEVPRMLPPPCRFETFKAGKREVLPCA